MITRIHVNQHNIRANLKGQNLPVLTVKSGKSNIKCNRAHISGPSEVVYSPDKPLSCGAKVWIETTSPVMAVDEVPATMPDPDMSDYFIPAAHVNRMDEFYMDVATRSAGMSRALRLQVGAVIVKDDDIKSFSWNGTPRGWDNTCEEVNDKGDLVTRVEVSHAEANCIAKLAKAGHSSSGAILYCTHSPCMECAKLICNSGITRVVYTTEYRSSAGIDFLRSCNVTVEKFKYAPISSISSTCSK